jgi:hypothetical protein
MAGYVELLATFKITVHVALFAGATNRPAEMVHVPLLLQVFFPFDGVVTNRVNNVLDFLLTEVSKTVKPGRIEDGATTADDVPNVFVPATATE